MSDVAEHLALAEKYARDEFNSGNSSQNFLNTVQHLYQAIESLASEVEELRKNQR